ncbi:alpha/beta fold hydrolase [Pseudomonas jilinensis]|uniref:3-oxoadipate enol-lactonase n=1 Tax=Pseudomonas jilinensis TaxID=2078689 RepID=A0A396RX22_9PSED|nr:alpha/beta hydrolase [Pseudomonas jilinensis]RHW21157.1 3-oxoadipate enol-lactonase [Pseudomonas jilinensis]
MNFIQLNNARIAYVREGQGVPVLLLHGLGSSLQDWQPQINDLSRYAQVWALDLRGHGDSQALRAPVTVAELAGDVAEFIETVGIQDCILVGISMGGMIGFELLARRPELLGGLVVINSAPSFPLDSWAVRFKVATRLAMIRLLGLKTLGHVLAHKLFPHPEQADLRRRVAQRLASNDRVSYLHALRAILGWAAPDSVNQADVPVLVVAGDRDYTPLAFKQAYTAQLLNAKLEVVCDSGHATPLDQPEQLNALLHDFIRRDCPLTEVAAYVP